ncbi:MAG: lipoprotein [Phycisphaeraceae bacterium]|nr:lipoprotein [Phycisphaeraceae bacterium]
MKRMLLILAAVAGLSGCQARYYRVTDLHTGKQFHTRSTLGGVFPSRSGTAGFTDLATGDRVYLHSYRVTHIDAKDLPPDAKPD